MASDDQQFLDFLANVPGSVFKFSANAVEQIFDSTDRAVDAVVDGVKGAARTAGPWLGLQSAPPPPPPAPVVPEAFYERTITWVSKNRAITAAVISFVGTGAIYIYVQRRYQTRKRRAKRAANGARKEVVVIAGPANSPVTKSLAYDLERRGFIIYVLVSSVEEEAIVQNEGRADIRPFHMDAMDPLATQQAVERFKSLLVGQHHAFAGAEPHKVNFAALIVAPDLQYPSGPIETVSAENWVETINTKVTGTVATTQAFLPVVCQFKSRVLVLTPSVVHSLRRPFHGVESTVVGALEGFTMTLRRELSTVGITVSQMKLGAFDYSSFGAKNHLQPRSALWTITWPASARSLYQQNFVNQGRIAERRGLFSDTGSVAKGSPLRELQNAVFDAITQKSPRDVWRIGRGSLSYDMAGAWLPAGLVDWMLGIRTVSLDNVAAPTLEEGGQQSWETVERGAAKNT